MMVVMLILSIIMAAFAPVMTTRSKVDLSSPWRWSSNNSDIYYGIGDTQTAMIGQRKKKTGDLESRLVINTSSSVSGQNHILFKSGGDTSSSKILAKLYLDVKENILLSNGSTSGQRSVSFGYNSLLNNSGNYNVALGYNNLSSNNSGSSNIAIGDSSLSNNSTGGNNVSIGTSLTNNTSGSYNTVVGDDSLKGNTTGSNNVSIGYNSLNSLISGSGNIAIGSESNKSIGSSVSNSISIGSSSLGVSDRSISIGTESRVDSAEGIAIGYQSYARDGSSIAIGSPGTYGSSNPAQSLGSGSISIGDASQALSSRSISIGPGTSARASSSLAIGEETIASGLNSIAIGSSSSSTGGASTAIGYLASSSGSSGTSLGYYAKSNSEGSAFGNHSTATGYYGVAVGSYSNGAGDSSIAIGYKANAKANNNIAIGYDACQYVNGSNKICIGAFSGPSYGSTWANASDTQERIFIGGKSKFNNRSSVLEVHNTSERISNGTWIYGGMNASGVVINGSLIVRGPIFTASRDNNAGSWSHSYSTALGVLEHYGSNPNNGVGDHYMVSRMPKDGNTPEKFHPLVYSSSDKRLKYVGNEFKNGLDKISQLKIYNYTFKKDKEQIPHVGVIAQDLQKVFPEAVKKGKDGFLQIRLEDMFYALINSVKELDVKVTDLSNQVKILQEQNKEIIKQNKRIESRLKALEASQ